ncbi:MAG: hypothetical protein KIT00_13370 [Rhodospirillales bacterium]|nr:hypothetical protein [Rhodospirillales bacterium]
MESRAEIFLDPSYGHFPDRSRVLARESIGSREAVPDEDLAWRRLGYVLCFCSSVTTLLLFITAYNLLFR